MFLTDKDAARFWKNVKIINDEHSCWLWVSGSFRAGYGSFSLRGRTEYAHRISYMLKHGPIPKGLRVLHACDEPHCVRPDHLSVDTHDKNMEEKARRGRTNVAKLNPTLVREIRKLLVSGEMSGAAIARQYGVNAMTVSLIKTGGTWRWLEEEDAL